MSNKLFLQNNPLLLSLTADKIGSAIMLLEKVKESYRIFYTHEVNGKFADLYIHCDTTNFANCYFYIGKLFERSKIL